MAASLLVSWIYTPPYTPFPSVFTDFSPESSTVTYAVISQRQIAQARLEELGKGLLLAFDWNAKPGTGLSRPERDALWTMARLAPDPEHKGLVPTILDHACKERVSSSPRGKEEIMPLILQSLVGTDTYRKAEARIALKKNQALRLCHAPDSPLDWDGLCRMLFHAPRRGGLEMESDDEYFVKSGGSFFRLSISDNDGITPTITRATRDDWEAATGGRVEEGPGPPHDFPDLELDGEEMTVRRNGTGEGVPLKGKEVLWKILEALHMRQGRVCNSRDLAILACRSGTQRGNVKSNISNLRKCLLDSGEKAV